MKYLAIQFNKKCKCPLYSDYNKEESVAIYKAGATISLHHREDSIIHRGETLDVKLWNGPSSFTTISNIPFNSVTILEKTHNLVGGSG